MSSAISNNHLFWKDKFQLQLFLNLTQMMLFSGVCFLLSPKKTSMLLWSINVKVKPATECQRLPLQAYLSWKEQWQQNVEENSELLKGRSYQVKCSVKWIWKTQLCKVSEKAMDLSEKNVVFLLFPVSDLYLEYCLAEPGLILASSPQCNTESFIG